MTSHYDELGIGKDATDDEIKSAFRKRAQQTHPDKTGDTQEFQAVKKAYDVISHPGRRGLYDEDGSDEEPSDSDLEVFLAEAFVDLCDSGRVDIEHDDIVSVMRQAIHTCEAEVDEDSRKIKLTIARRRRALKRLKRKAGPNVMSSIIEIQLAKEERKIAANELQKERSARMLKILDGYEYHPDVQIRTPSRDWLQHQELATSTRMPFGK